MVTVITYGTFDLFHFGHVRLLNRLRRLGDRLVIGCSSDEFNVLKGKRTVVPYEHRREILLSCRYVADVFPENNWEQKRDDIIREQADIFGMGHDWTGKFDDLSDLVKVVYLPRTDGVSTTDLKHSVRSLPDPNAHMTAVSDTQIDKLAIRGNLDQYKTARIRGSR